MQEIVALLLVWTNIDVDIDSVILTVKETNDNMPGQINFKTYLQSSILSVVSIDLKLPSRMFMIISILFP